MGMTEKLAQGLAKKKLVPGNDAQRWVAIILDVIEDAGYKIVNKDDKKDIVAIKEAITAIGDVLKPKEVATKPGGEDACKVSESKEQDRPGN